MMRRACSFGVVPVICLGLLGSAPGLSADDAARKRFEAEYPAALKRLQERFGRVHGSGKLTATYKEDAGVKTRESAVRFWADGTKLRHEATRLFQGQPDAV